MTLQIKNCDQIKIILYLGAVNALLRSPPPIMKKPGRPQTPKPRKRIKLNSTVPSCLVEKARIAAEKSGMDLSHYVENALRKQVESDT